MDRPNLTLIQETPIFEVVSPLIYQSSRVKNKVIILVISHSIRRLRIEVKAREMTIFSTRCRELVVIALDPRHDWAS